MDPALISALSGAPATVVALFIAVQLLRESRSARRDFLDALAAERSAIEGVAKTLQSLRTAIDRQGGLVFALYVGRMAREDAERARKAHDDLKEE